MVSFERESRWIRVSGILPESLGESDSQIGVQLLTLYSDLCQKCDGKKMTNPISFSPVSKGQTKFFRPYGL